MLLCLLYCALPLFGAALPQDTKKSWPADVEQALTRAKDNRPEIEKALSAAPQEQRNGMTFVVANMCDQDLRSLKADFLLENLELAYKARREFAWCRNL